MIGYACLALGFRDYSFKKIQEKNINRERLEAVIANNLDSLERLIDYNEKIGVKMFRISSDIIPFGNKYLDLLNYKEHFRPRFEAIANKIEAYSMRMSMHPGQYTVLNSRRGEVVERAVWDLAYHNDFLDLLKLDSSHKIIIHVGGVYGDKQASRQSFIENYRRLEAGIRSRLVIENDHRSYHVEDLLYIHSRLGLPLVFDQLHDEILPGPSQLSLGEILELFKRSWKDQDGRQKIHYSQQANSRPLGSHSRTIDLEQFKDFYGRLDTSVDIMLEVKDKDLSARKCNNLIQGGKIKTLEEEWARYKYNILEHDPRAYNKIRGLLKDKSQYPILEFYQIIDRALARPLDRGNFINGFDHSWGYFKDQASQDEKRKKQAYLKRYLDQSIGEAPMKRFILDLAKKYGADYLLRSYYFNF